MKEEIRKLFIEKTGIKAEDLNEEFELTDLGIDSLKLLMLVNEFEERFNVEISDEDLLKIHTFGDIVRIINKSHE